jgi:hypothetical protein
MPRPEADRLSLHADIALDAMHRGQGNVNAAQRLCQAVILTGLLAEAGYGIATCEQMHDAETVISTAFDRGCDSGRQFAAIVTTYDRQLQRRAPLSAIAGASDRLDRFRAGESFEDMALKWA